MVVGPNSVSSQVAVIGAGPGGYLAAIRLGQLGKDVVLIEKRPSLGGVCLNEGCIPSKALIHAAHVYDQAAHAAEMGLSITRHGVDMARLMKWKGGVVRRLTAGVKHLVSKTGGQILQGAARFTTDRQLAVTGDDGSARLVNFERAIIATGTESATLPGFESDGETVVGSREALALTTLPERLIVIGGGYIGLELGIAYAKLGSRTTVVELLPELLPDHEPEIRAALTRSLQLLGVTVLTGTRAESMQRGTVSKVMLRAGDGSLQTIEADLVVVSVGRRPATAQLGLDALRLRVDARGFVMVDERMETNLLGIYAVGDVAGGVQLAHKAYREGKVAAEVICGLPSAYDACVVPAVIYADPEIASAGLTARQAREQGFEVCEGVFPYRASGRALTTNATDGLVKVVAEAKSQRLLGVHIAGREAGELIAEATLALEMGALLDDLSLTIHPHPTMSEALMEAADVALGRGAHTLS